LVRETAVELSRLSGKNDDLGWEAALYRGLAKNCAEKAALAKALAPKAGKARSSARPCTH
jgi:hypothetical protein